MIGGKPPDPTIDGLIRRIDALERNHAGTLLVLEAHDAEHQALLAKYEEHAATLTEASYAAERQVEEIRGLKESISNLVTANGHLSNRIEALSDRLYAIAAGGSGEP